MKKIWVIPAFCLAMVTATGAEAGCLAGAAMGGTAGHFLGHHALIGAAVGCAIGHHRTADRRRMDQRHDTDPNVH
jgi:hypothetical protein